VRGIAAGFPRSDELGDIIAPAQSLVEALATADGQLDLVHVQVTPVLARVVQLRIPRYAARLLEREHLIEHGLHVHVRVVQQDADYARRSTTSACRQPR
jgi:hypothetical protein